MADTKSESSLSYRIYLSAAQNNWYTPESYAMNTPIRNVVKTLKRILPS